MRAEDRLCSLFEDLEQQAEGLALAERDAELLDLRRAEYAEVTFASRLHASLGAAVTLAVTGVGTLSGTLARVGEGWCLLEATHSGQEWVVRDYAVSRASGLAAHAVTAAARPVAARLSLRSVLRGLADSRAEVVLHHLDGTHQRGTPARVGADFTELVALADGPARSRQPVEVVPLARLAALRRA